MIRKLIRLLRRALTELNQGKTASKEVATYLVELLVKYVVLKHRCG